ncbi:hypothetical protein Tco_1209339 [Tanacetum coccineum]
MKAMQEMIKAGIIPFKTDQEILDEVVPSDNCQNMSGMGRKLPDRIDIVPGPMTHLVASLAPNNANSYVMQGASCTQRKVSMVLFVLPSILLLVVIIVTVVIVVVIPVVVVVVIVGVVVVVVARASRAAVIPSVISCRMAASVMVGAVYVDVFLGGNYMQDNIE